MKLLHPTRLIRMPYAAAFMVEPDFAHGYDFDCKNIRETDRGGTSWQQVLALLARRENAQKQKKRDWPTAFKPEPTAV